LKERGKGKRFLKEKQKGALPSSGGKKASFYLRKKIEYHAEDDIGRRREDLP